ncbi:MAG: leucyl aminopeptidase, partial [Acidimicrobiales bacterium]
FASEDPGFLDGDPPIDRESARRQGFTGAVGQHCFDVGRPLRLLVGLGRIEELTEGRLRQAGATMARAAASCDSIAVDIRPLEGLSGPDGPGGSGGSGDGFSPERAAQVIAEGIGGASYRFSLYRSAGEEEVRLSAVHFVSTPSFEGPVGRGLELAAAGAKAVALARDLANTPAGDLTPERLAEAAREQARLAGLEVTVLGEEEIAVERLGGLLAVARGSAEPPRLIRLVYEPRGEPGGGSRSGRQVPTVVLVGKGITFDSGGLSLKTGTGMMAMKTDMSGAAAVISVLGACGAFGVPVRVIGIAPTTENMPGGRATKPGDVFTARNGKTIEVLNTDAEGRLVLADGLSLAAEEEPDAIVDVATLTGACVVALGRRIAGLMGNDSRLASQIERAAARAGEPVWRLPLPSTYRCDLDSEVADMKNIGKPGNAGALVAGLVLQEFVGDRPWAHLDIAGPSRSEDGTAELGKGPTGFGVRTLLEFLASYEPIGSVADESADASVRRAL